MSAINEIAAERRHQIEAQGYDLERDNDGDWILWPPAGVTIVSVPGEGLLIGRCDEVTAITDAVAEIERLDRTAQEPSP